MPPSAIMAACCGVQGGHSRVLERPATGALAMTATVRLIREHPGHVAYGAGGARAVPVTLERPLRGW